MVTGSSIRERKACSHWAPRAPSTTRWSHDSVTGISVAASNPAGPGTTRCDALPTAKMQACPAPPEAMIHAEKMEKKSTIVKTFRHQRFAVKTKLVP